MKKIITIIMILLAFNLNVKAEENEYIFDYLPTYEKEGKTYLDLKLIDPSKMISKYNEIICSDNPTDTYCIEDYYYRVFAMLVNDYKTGSLDYNISYDNGKITITYYDTESTSHDYYIEFEESKDENITKISNEINNNKYVIYGDSLINLASKIDNFTYYSFKDKSIEDKNYNLLLSMFPEFKEIIEKYPDYTFKIITGPSGGFPGQMNGGCIIGIYKDNLLLDIEYVDFEVNSILLIPESDEENLNDSTLNLLSKYIDTSKITITDNLDMSEEDIKDILYNAININKHLGLTKTDYRIKTVDITINGASEFYYIVEVPKENYQELIVKSFDSKTGISFYSSGYNIPSDTKIIVDDLRDNKIITENGKENNIDLTQIYDISLKRLYDNSLIENTPFGVDIYLPTDKYQEGETVKIYYIKDEKIQDEEILGNVVQKDGNTYIKFTAKHFSVYAIGEEIETEEVPETLDNISQNIILAILSLTSVIIIIKKYKFN